MTLQVLLPSLRHARGIYHQYHHPHHPRYTARCVVFAFVSVLLLTLVDFTAAAWMMMTASPSKITDRSKVWSTSDPRQGSRRSDNTNLAGSFTKNLLRRRSISGKRRRQQQRRQTYSLSEQAVHQQFEACPPGMYRDEEDSFSYSFSNSSSNLCQPCPTGTYSSSSSESYGSNSATDKHCNECSAGSYAPRVGMTACWGCDSSYYNGTGSDYGFYDPSANVTYCVAPLYLPLAEDDANNNINNSNTEAGDDDRTTIATTESPSLSAASPVPSPSPSTAPSASSSFQPSWVPTMASPTDGAGGSSQSPSSEASAANTWEPTRLRRGASRPPSPTRPLSSFSPFPTPTSSSRPATGGLRPWRDTIWSSLPKQKTRTNGDAPSDVGEDVEFASGSSSSSSSTWRSRVSSVASRLRPYYPLLALGGATFLAAAGVLASRRYKSRRANGPPTVGGTNLEDEKTKKGPNQDRPRKRLGHPHRGGALRCGGRHRRQPKLVTKAFHQPSGKNLDVHPWSPPLPPIPCPPLPADARSSRSSANVSLESSSSSFYSSFMSSSSYSSASFSSCSSLFSSSSSSSSSSSCVSTWSSAAWTCPSLDAALTEPKIARSIVSTSMTCLLSTPSRATPGPAPASASSVPLPRLLGPIHTGDDRPDNEIDDDESDDGGSGSGSGSGSKDSDYSDYDYDDSEKDGYEIPTSINHSDCEQMDEDNEKKWSKTNKTGGVCGGVESGGGGGLVVCYTSTRESQKSPFPGRTWTGCRVDV